VSFSAEMKAFLGAYQTGQKINASRTDQEYKAALTDKTQKATERENDPATLELERKTAEAKLAKLSDSLLTGKAQRGAIGARTQLTQEQIRQLRQQGLGGTGLLPPTDSVGPAGPVPQGQGALPIGPSTMVSEPEIDPFPPGSQYNPGGAYAMGGMVPDDEESELSPDDEVGEGESGGVLPITPVAAPANAPTDVSARRRTEPAMRGIEGIVAPGVVQDAVKAGMTFGARESGLANGGAVASPRTMAMAKQIAAGAGGLSEQEMAAAKKAVDPEGKLTESQRNMAALGSVYQYWANQGDPKRAEKVAFQMLQYYRNASQRYAAIAAKAAEGGNVDLATKAALKAYQNVPDGNDMHLEVGENGQIIYQMTGPKGEVIRKGVATPQQLAASAMGMASGGFDKALLSAAGAREAEQGGKGAVGGAKAGRTQSASDRAKEEETAMGAVEALKANWAKDEKNKGKEPDETMWEQMGNLATHIMQGNKVTSKEAARAADLLINPPRNKEGGDFKLSMGDDGVNTIKFKNGLSVKLDDDQLEQVQNARAARIKAAADKEAADKAEAAKSGLLSKVTEGAIQVGKGLGEDGDINPVKIVAKKVGSTAAGALKSIYGEHIPQSVVDAVEATKGAISGAVDTVGDAVKRRVSNPNAGAIPVDAEDRPL